MSISKWALFVFLLFTPMIIELIFISDISPVVQQIFQFWKGKNEPVILSDILFTEAAIFLVFGALIGGVTLYNAWVPTDVRKAQFTDYIWNWKKIKEERNFPTGLIAGLTLLTVGIIYLLGAIVVPSIIFS